MHELRWSASEKKIARAAFDDALQSALAKLMTEFKARAAAAETPSDMWAIADYLRHKRHEVDALFDYRYSQLICVLGRLIREGHLAEGRLQGLSDDKLEMIRHIQSL